MRKIFTVTIVFALAIAFSSCATRKVSRVNTNEVIDLSGRWNGLTTGFSRDDRRSSWSSLVAGL